MNPNYEGLKSEVKRSQNLIDAKIDPKSIWGDYLMMKCELEAELLEIKKKKQKPTSWRNPSIKEWYPEPEGKQKDGREGVTPGCISQDGFWFARASGLRRWRKGRSQDDSGISNLKDCLVLLAHLRMEKLHGAEDNDDEFWAFQNKGYINFSQST